MNIDLVVPKTTFWQPRIEMINPVKDERVARDLEARFLYATINAFGQLAAVTGALLAAVVLIHFFGWRAGLLVVIGAALFGLWVVYEQSAQHDRIRAAVLDNALRMMEREKLTFDETVDKVIFAIKLNMAIGLAGTAALLAGFAAVAVRARPKDLDDADAMARQLRLRLHYLTLLVLVGAAILVLLVAANKVLLAWPQGMMKPEAAKAYGVLASAVANYWGGLGTGILLCTLMPAVISIKADIDKASGARGVDFSAQEKWRKENGLEVAPSSALATAATAAAPLLTGPVIDIVSAFVKG
ncbi:MAG: hypothetical protein WCE79_26620 [Xanthobacteraceae bacterium]